MFLTCLINSVTPVDLVTLYFAALFPEMKKEDKDLLMLTRI